MKPLGCLLILLPGGSISCQFKASLEGIPSLATIAITIPYFKNSLWRSSPVIFYGRLGLLGSHHLSFRTEQKTATVTPLHSVCRPTSCKDSSTSRGCSSKASRYSDPGRCDFGGKVARGEDDWESPGVFPQK